MSHSPRPTASSTPTTRRIVRVDGYSRVTRRDVRSGARESWPLVWLPGHGTRGARRARWRTTSSARRPTTASSSGCRTELVLLQEAVRATACGSSSCSRAATPPARAARSSASPSKLNPRVCHVVALGTPTERERSQWYFQRYIDRMPAAGEMVLFDRSWYNRAGVERVMGFCSEADVEEFFRAAPEIERMLVRAGIVLIKYWLEVSAAGAALAPDGARGGPHQAVEAQPHRRRGAPALRRLLARAWPTSSTAPTSPRRRGTWWTPTTRSAPA